MTEVGKAYLGRDGVVRWIGHKSKRGYFHCMWLAEEENVWYSGHPFKAGSREEGCVTEGGEVPAPQGGDTYRLVGPLGHIRECRVPEETT